MTLKEVLTHIDPLNKILVQDIQWSKDLYKLGTNKDVRKNLYKNGYANCEVMLIQHKETYIKVLVWEG